MKIMHKIMASALMLAIGLSTASATTTTHDWFAVDFESGYATNAVLAGVSKADGAWSKTGDDASTMTNQTASNVGKINGLGGSLVWTPTSAPVVGNSVLLDADVYMVGSEDAPAAISTGTVQTEVFMTNVSVGVSYLCAHVGNGSGGSKWVKLQGVTVSDMTWIHLRIEINYDANPNTLSFYVGDAGTTGGTQMTDGTPTDSFPVMELGKDQTKVTSVSFMGTGYLDNFIGKTVTLDPYDGGTFNADGDDHDSNITGTNIGVVDNVVTTSFEATKDGGAIRYIQITSPAGYVRTVRTSTGSATFSTLDLASGTYTITAYYGLLAPSLTTGLAAPVAETVGANKAAEVVAGNISFTVAPKSGLYYTLFAGTTPTSLTAAADSVLASPANDKAGGGSIKLTMPVPVNPNEVKIIKIYASDEEYDAGDTVIPNL